MSWHVYSAQELRHNADGSTTVRLTNPELGAYLEVEGTELCAGDLTSIVIHETRAGNGAELYTAPTDVLYLDPRTGKAAYDPSPLIPASCSA